MASYSSRLTADGGSHPYLVINVTHSSADPPCDLYAFITVPPTFIVDKYQLQRLCRAGRLVEDQHGGDMSTLVQVEGEADLEAPAWRTTSSNVLLRLRGAKPRRRRDGLALSWDVHEVPLHLRYQGPQMSHAEPALASPDHVSVNLTSPAVFWACPPNRE